jgi:leucyl-tRNA synthetase
VRIVPKMAEEAVEISESQMKTQLNTGPLSEYEILHEAETFLRKEFKAEVHVFKENDTKRHDPKQRARLAKPYRSAIFIE